MSNELDRLKADVAAQGVLIGALVQEAVMVAEINARIQDLLTSVSPVVDHPSSKYLTKLTNQILLLPVVVAPEPVSVPPVDPTALATHTRRPRSASKGNLT